jgi:hypothetical protein
MVAQPDQRLRRGTHRSFQALERDIREWIVHWNDNPKPFSWTKTADEIYGRLASYLQQIPGAGRYLRREALGAGGSATTRHLIARCPASGAGLAGQQFAGNAEIVGGIPLCAQRICRAAKLGWRRPKGGK